MNDVPAESDASSSPIWRSRLTVLAWRIIAIAARTVPRPVIGPLTRLSGYFSRIYGRQSRRMARRHQQRVAPDLSNGEVNRLVDDVFARYAQYWIESLRLPHLDRRRVEHGITVEGYEHVREGLAHGRGVILALPHLGGWEWAGRWLADRGIEVVAVAERIEPPALFEWMTALRERLGIQVVALDASAGTAVLAALKRNAVVCLLCDRDIQGGGVEVEFFGEVTTIPAGPAALAVRTGAALLPTAVFHTDRAEGHLGVVMDPIPCDRQGRPLRAAVAEVSAQLASALEDLIRRAPTQWHLLQPNWGSDRR